MSRRADDALSWDGDDDPTLDTGVAPDTSPASTLPAGWTAVGAGSESVTEADAASDPAAEQDRDVPAQTEDGGTDQPAPSLGNAALITLGVLGGVYLLWTIGWVVGGFRLRALVELSTGSEVDAMFLASMWLGILAPVLWFGTVWVATRTARSWMRFVWLVVGVVLLVPWPFVMVGVIGL